MRLKKLDNKSWVIVLIAVSVSLLFHLNVVVEDIQGLHTWRQSQTMWNIRNFVRTDFNILNPRTNVFNGDNDNIYRYEFPIMQWLVALIQKVFGQSMVIVRLCFFIVATWGLAGICRIVKELTKNNYIAGITTFLYQFSPIFYYYSFTPLPDVLALASGTWYLYFMVKFAKSESTSHVALASFFLLISTLAKLPFLMFAIVSLPMLVSAMQIGRWKFFVSIIMIHSIFISPALFWYAWVMPGWVGNPVLTGIFAGNYSIFEFGKLIGFHAVKMFPNKLLSFPSWIFFAVGFYGVFSGARPSRWLQSLIGITVLYLFLQLTAIGRDHDYYLFPFLPWLYVCVGLGMQSLWSSIRIHRRIVPVGCGVAAIYCIAITSKWNDKDMSNFNKDVFEYSELLKSAVPQGELCIILNDPSNYIFAYRIDKMGYVFSDDYLPISWLDDLVRNHQITYMYSDSYIVNEDQKVAEYIDTTLLSVGNIKVFKLMLPD